MRYAWIVILMIGCYEAPDYSGAHFKCDAEHACPDGQQCINGTCGGGGSGSGMIDAPLSQSGVACGATTCGVNQKCFADFINGPSCIAPSASCTGFSATCDGKEDCGGQSCCETGSVTIGCVAACSGYVICRDDDDCAANMPKCCPAIGTMEPWGRCYVACP